MKQWKCEHPDPCDMRIDADDKICAMSDPCDKMKQWQKDQRLSKLISLPWWAFVIPAILIGWTLAEFVLKYLPK